MGQIPTPTDVSASTLVELLRTRAERQPDRWAYSFLADGDEEELRLTYAELDLRARATAAELRRVAPPGARVLLFYPAGLDYVAAFFGCLYAGMVAVPAYPPRNERMLPRVLAILADAEPSVVLTTTALLPRLRGMLQEAPNAQSLRWLDTTQTPGTAAGEWTPPAIEEKSIAFLQYTSGSTATPKGVMLTHRNLLENSAAICERFEMKPENLVMSWLPAYHDMGLIGGVLQPIYSGLPCVLMAPVAFIQRPLRWLRAITRFGITCSGGPSFAYELCLQIPPAQREGLDLSSWDVAFNGSEPIHAATLARFAEAYAPYGFRSRAFLPCYGLAESTLIASGSVKGTGATVRSFDKGGLEAGAAVPSEEGASARPLVSCGPPATGQTIRIVDPNTRRSLPAETIGEIWLAGPSIAQGYWNRNEESEATFQADTADTAEGPFLRTGDLGFFSEGELYVTGRLKDLIIFRGRNYYPQDIELTVGSCHESLRRTGGAAFSVPVAGEERLVVVQEVAFREQPDIDEVTGAVRLAVARQHELEAYAVVLIRPGTLPKTSSGKVQRRLCQKQYLAGELDLFQSSNRPGGSRRSKNRAETDPADP